MNYLTVILVSICAAYLVNSYLCYYLDKKVGKQIFTGGLEISKRNIFSYLLFILVGVIFILVFSKYDYSYLKIYRYLLLAFVLYPIAVVDKKKRIVPNKLILLLLILRLTYLGVEVLVNRYLWKEMLGTAFLGMLIGGGIFIIAYIIGKKSVGMGDVKLFAAVGFFVGSTNILICIIISLFLTGITGLGMMIFKGLKVKDYLPLAPFVLLGTLISMILGY